VSDGFDFRPPPPRREARRFEPPPWEREQFERLARERAEQEAAERELAAKLAADGAAREPESAETSADAPARAVAAEQVADVPSAPASSAPPASAGPKPELDEKHVARLMLELRAEEPRLLTGAWMVGLGSGLVLALAGFVLAAWGGFALSNSRLGQLGKLGGGILIVFGIGFVGTGGWLIFRALRQRGVL